MEPDYGGSTGKPVKVEYQRRRAVMFWEEPAIGPSRPMPTQLYWRRWDYGANAWGEWEPADDPYPRNPG